MLIDKSHRTWAAATFGLLALSSIAYGLYVYSAPKGATGGSIPGMIFGILSAALMVYAGLLWWRKKYPTWRIGRASTWLKGHIWLGSLSVPLALFHAGFRWGGPLTILLWITLALIVFSGIVGLILQHVVPRLMTERCPLETIYEQIPQVSAPLLLEADASVAAIVGPLPVTKPAIATDELLERKKVNKEQLAIYVEQVPPEEPPPAEGEKKPPRRKGPVPVLQMEGTEPLLELYLNMVRPYIENADGHRSSLKDAGVAHNIFDRIRKLLPEQAHETTDRLRSYCEERRQLTIQTKLHHLLHSWMFVHLPLSVALMVLGIAHVVTVLWY